jgi:hypothetical protein
MRNIIPIFFILVREIFFFFQVGVIMRIEVALVNETRKKIANGLAKLNYIVKFLDLTVNKVVSRGEVYRACAVPSHNSVGAIIFIIVVAVTISALSLTPGHESKAFTIPSLTSYSTPLNAISPYSVEQSSQLYQTPLLTLGTGLETPAGQDSSETASISSVSSSSTPATSSTMSTDSTSAPPPSTTNQATTTTSSTGTPTTTTQQSSGPAPAPTPPPTTSPSPPAAQQQLSSIYQQPAAPQPQSTIQQLPAQPLFQTSPQTQSLLQSNPAQPYGIPSTTATIQPQLSALPPTATTFPPSVLPPVNSLQPYGTTAGLGYPSTIGGQYGLGAAGSAAGAAATSVSTSSQLVSPWFPSLPATYCGGTFLLTIEGTPRGDGDKNNKIEPADNNNRKDNNGGGDNDDNDDHHKNSKHSDRERRLLSLQINSDNSRIFTDDDAIFGQIFQGKKNIDENKGNDFDIKSIFNDCQVVTFSSKS